LIRSLIIGVCFLAVLSACESTPKKLDEEKLAYISSIKTISVNPLWSVQLADHGINRISKQRATLSDKILYVADHSGLVMALHADSGKHIWKKQFTDAFTAGPNVANNYLALGTRDAGVLLLDKNDGQLIWKKSVSSEILAAPQISSSNVIVQSNDGKITALDLRSGEQVWVYDRNVPPLTLRGTASPVITEDKVITGFANGKLVALSVDDGKMIWETTIAVPKGRSELERMVDVDGLIQVHDDTVYVSSFQGRAVALTAGTGRILWTREMSSHLGVSMANDLLFITDVDGKIWALDRRNGSTLWVQEKLKKIVTTTPLVVAENLIVGGIDGSIFSLAKEDGKVLGRVDYQWLGEETGIINLAESTEVKNAFDAAHDIEDVRVISPPLSNGKQIFVPYQNGAFISLAYK